jgi:hypothetical protein
MRAAILAALALSLVLPPSLGAAEKAIWGPTQLPNGRSTAPLYDDLGVDTVQIPLHWPAIAPTRPNDPVNPADPAYSWPAEVDSALGELAPRGIRLALLVTGSPPWANGGRRSIYAPRAGDFADFLTATSRRYPSVRRWMIWGEPNKASRFQPSRPGQPTSARAYAVILQAAYDALKRSSRSNIVIGGMTWTGGEVKPAPFLRFLKLPNGRRPCLDWFGHNPFPFRFPNLRSGIISGGWRDISDVDTFSREVKRAYTRRRGRRRVPRCGRQPKLWLSEFTVQSDRGSSQFELSVGRQAQARWLAAGYGIADQVPAVAGLGWIELLDEPPARGSANWGLMTSDGRRKPALSAYRRAPSRRFRPLVRARRAIRGGTLARRGLRVRIGPKVSGRVRAYLTTRGGRVMRRGSRRIRAGRARSVALRGVRLRRGRYLVVVIAPRAERVRRKLTVR